MKRTWAWIGGLAMVALGVFGCGGKTAYVTQYPHWEYEKYERLAVVPMNEPPGAGEVLTDRLTTLLAGNGAFRVLSRSEMREIAQEQDLASLATGVNDGAGLSEAQIEIAQALVIAQITEYEPIATREQRKVPIYGRDRRGRVARNSAGLPIVVGEQTHWVYQHGARVTGSVRVVDPATSAVLLSDTQTIQSQMLESVDSPPRVSPAEMARRATQELAMAFYKKIAPVRIEVKLKSDMLVVATDYFDGRYDTFKDLPPSRPSFLVVVSDLPSECDRNRFKIAIAPKDERRNVFEQDFEWSDGLGKQGMTFEVPTSTLVDSGAIEFVAKLYSGDPEPILERDFKLKVDKGKE